MTSALRICFHCGQPLWGESRCMYCTKEGSAMNANDLTNRAWKAHRRGRRAFFLTRRAVYQGWRESGHSVLRSLWEAITW